MNHVFIYSRISYILLTKYVHENKRNPIDTKITRGGWVLEFYFQEGILTIWACLFDHRKIQIGSGTQNQRTELKTETETKTDRADRAEWRSGESKNAYVRFFLNLIYIEKNRRKGAE